MCALFFILLPRLYNNAFKAAFSLSPLIYTPILAPVHLAAYLGTKYSPNIYPLLMYFSLLYLHILTAPHSYFYNFSLKLQILKSTLKRSIFPPLKHPLQNIHYKTMY